MMKIFYLILSLLFFLFGLAQINDPDPWLWLTWYFFVAILLGMAAFKRFFNLAIWIGIGAALSGFVFLMPDFMQWFNDGMPSIVSSMKAESPYIELVRETLGLLLSLFALIGIWIYSRMNRRISA
ncbi:MAG: hypothetical protein HC912_08225 [Saprospiraceae bacterium]|nr:hypothetical protein [Saprospiraceae bacterium]